MAAWLSGWAKRVIITLDHLDIESALADFPHLIEISTTSGYNDKDITFVFDELQNDANRKKIAVTTDDGVTECYVEIEHWDHVNEKAWLWVKVPAIASGEDTDIYLYYDRTHADNDAYVGDPSDAVTHNVWDDNFKLITHMRDDPDTSHIRDSTQYANDGTKKGAGEPVVTTAGMIDDAQDFDGDDDINCGSDSSLDITSAITLEVWIKPGIWQPLDGIIGKWDSDAGKRCFWLCERDTDKIQFFISTSGTNAFVAEVLGAVVDTWHYIVGTYDGSTIRAYRNGIEGTPRSIVASIFSDPTQPVIIGAEVDMRYFDGIIDESRISDIARTPAWIKAGYESQRDHLNDFGAEETLPLPPPTGGIPPLILRPPPRRTAFIKRLITFSQIRRSFAQEGRLTGRIRRLFQDEVVFFATAIKRIDELIYGDAFIVTDDIPDHAWEAFAKELEVEQEEKELIE